jgi:hypothetical protein
MRATCEQLSTVDRVRALGETDLNPVSGLGKISQLLFAWIQPGNIAANIIAGGIAEAGAQQRVFPQYCYHSRWLGLITIRAEPETSCRI